MKPRPYSQQDVLCDIMFSAIWGMEGYYDTTTMQRDARKLLLRNVEDSCTTSVSADGVKLIEMPLRYDRYLPTSIHL